MRKKPLLIFVAVITGVIFLLSAALFYLVGTTKGSQFLTRFGLSRYVEPEEINIQETKGSLLRGITFKNIEFRDVKGFPPGSIIKIQTLEVVVTSLGLEGITAKVTNGRLKLPSSDPILFYGKYEQGLLNLNVYTKRADVRAILDAFPEGDALKKLSGTVSDFDVYIKGTLFQPMIKGMFTVETLYRKGFSMKDCPVVFEVNLKDIKDNLKVYGEITLKKGTVSGRKTAKVELRESKIFFSGNPTIPSLDVKGTSYVEKTTINIVLRGTMEAPEIKLTSEPPKTETQLLLMLATGRSWKSAEGTLRTGKLSPDIVSDFVDYFVFAGRGSKVAQHLGVSELSLIYDEQKKGIAVKKTLSDKVEASYGIEQAQQKKEQKATTTHKVGGEVKATESISVGVEREVQQDESKDTQGTELQTKDKIYLKYKKEF